MHSHRPCLDGIRLRCCPFWVVSATTANRRAGSLSATLWFVTVVWNRTHRSRSGNKSIFRLAPPSANPRLGSRPCDAPHAVTLAVATAIFLALVGLGMAIYLISVRTSANLYSENRGEVSMAPVTNKGIFDKPSNHLVDQTVEKLKNILQSKGITLFALIDHSGEAEKAGMKMRPTKLLIFGSPKAGTPVMLAAPSIAIDLPLKI